jgi:uncharacterized protein
MTPYFDASALLALLLNEPAGDAVDRFLQNDDQAVGVSTLCVAECSAAISGLVRMNRRSEPEAMALLQQLDGWLAAFSERASVLDADIEDACLLVRRFDLKLRTPDAIHLAVTRRLGARLVTLDRPMTRTASLLNIDCVDPTAPSN